MRHFAAAVATLVVLSACPKRVEEPLSPERTLRLLADAPERETTTLSEIRADIEIDTRDHDRRPHIVATGETPLLTANGLTARLFGDEAATLGFAVDNFLLLEILAENGQVLERVSIGFTDPVSIGTENIDNLGRRAFAFEPGEINLTSKLPERRPFKIRATALDYFGVGRVSDVFLVMRAESPDHSSDDLRGQ